MEREYLSDSNVTQLNDLLVSLRCGKCNKMVDKARSLSCQHIFCENCLSQLLPSGMQAIVGDGVSTTSSTDRFHCPVCRKMLPATEVVDARPQKELTEISRLLQDVIEVRPTCDSCSNKRWLALGCDYKRCDTCRKILCPLCALDFHRDHDLQSNFSDTLRASREFAHKTVPVKREWNEITKQVEEAKEMARKAGAWIASMKAHVQKTERGMADVMTSGLNAYRNVQNLQTARFDNLVDAQRNEAIKSLEANVKILQEKMPPMVASVGNQMKMITAVVKELEKIPDENGKLVVFEPPPKLVLMNATSPTT